MQTKKASASAETLNANSATFVQPLSGTPGQKPKNSIEVMAARGATFAP